MIELFAGPFGPMVIFVLRVVDVSVGTIRFLLVTRGARALASVLGFVEILLWILAAGAAIQNLTSVWHILGYALGFAAGTWTGAWLEERLAVGTATVQAFSRSKGDHVARALRSGGHGVTRFDGEGLDGPVAIVSTVVRRRVVPRVLEVIESTDPDAFVTVYDARARGGHMPPSVRRK